MYSIKKFLVFTKLVFDVSYVTITNPKDIVTQLKSIQFNLTEVHSRTDIDREQLIDFFNSTLPCLINKTTDQTDLTSDFNPDDLQQKFPLECFQANVGKICRDNNVSATIFWIMQACAVIFQIFIAFSHRRKKCSLWFCGGRPGIVVPLNMLDSYENRWGAAAAFCLTVQQCLLVLMSKYEKLFGDKTGAKIEALPSYASIFIKVVCAIFISQVAYPFFVCQNMKNKFVGSLIGFFLALLWFSMELSRTVVNIKTCWVVWEESGYGGKFGILNMLYDWPLYICLVWLMIKFLIVFFGTLALRRNKQIIEHVKIKNWLRHDDIDFKKEYMYLHVENLLKTQQKEMISENESGDVEFCEKLKSKLYKKKQEFKYSTRMLSSMVVAVLVIYMFCVFLISSGYVLFVKYWRKIFTADLIENISERTHIPTSLIDDLVKAVASSWWMAVGTASIFSCIVIFNSLTWYRRHIIQLRKGDRTFLPKTFRNAQGTGDNAVSLMVASMKFAGFQIAYTAWGFVLLFLVAFLLYTIFITQLIIPIKRWERSFLIDLIITYWPTVFITVLMMISQQIMASKFFLLDQKSLAVDNRRAYHIMSYLFFYFNTFLGLFSCLLRILYGIIFGVLFMQRLQKSTLSRTLEEKDPGYYAYLGYILLEHQHANPVLQCFTRLLLESRQKVFVEGEKSEYTADLGFNNPAGVTLLSSDTLTGKDTDSHVQKENRRKIRARTRWWLFIMLSQNSSLRKHRKINFKTRTPKNIFKMMKKNVQSKFYDSLQKDIAPLKNENNENDTDTDHSEPEKLIDVEDEKIEYSIDADNSESGKLKDVDDKKIENNVDPDNSKSGKLNDVEDDKIEYNIDTDTSESGKCKDEGTIASNYAIETYF